MAPKDGTPSLIQRIQCAVLLLQPRLKTTPADRAEAATAELIVGLPADDPFIATITFGQCADNAGFDGYAVGGLSVGEPAEDFDRIVRFILPKMPQDKPRYLMGSGTPEEILLAVENGIDMFDCVMPTRNGRNGMLFTSNGIINIKNKKWQDDLSSIDENGSSYVDKEYSKAYLRHLIISKEILGAQIASIHNLSFYLSLMQTARDKIQEGNFLVWKNKMVKKLSVKL